MSSSLRQQIADYLVTAIQEIEEPRVSKVTKEPFEVSELAITQFPAVLVSFAEETRETITMGAPGIGRRTGTIEFNLRAFVRGTELDKRRNEILEAIEEQLERDRNLGLKEQGVMDTQVVRIENIPRLSPIAEISIDVEVRYNYLRSIT